MVTCAESITETIVSYLTPVALDLNNWLVVTLMGPLS